MRGIESVSVAMMWLRKEGTMWRKIIRRSLAPQKRAAITKSSSRSARKRPRTARASPVHSIMAKTSVKAK